jgi:transposase-like protein
MKEREPRDLVDCTFCGLMKSSVERTIPLGGVVMQRRKCKGCNRTFSSYVINSKRLSDTGVSLADLLEIKDGV